MEPLNLSLAHCIHGKPELAVPILEAEAAKGNLAAKFNLGWHRLREGKFKEGFEGLNYGRWLQVFGNPVPVKDTPIPRLKTDDLLDKKLLFNSEGGLGDEIANVRFAKDFSDMGADVTITASSENDSLFERLGMKVIERKSFHEEEYDFWVPAMSAPYVLGYDYNTLSGKAYLPYQKRTVNSPLKIGLKWAGNPDFEHEQHRVFPKELMLNLAHDNRFHFYSFQKEFDESGLSRPNMSSMADTAYSLAKMDLLITSCSSTAHLGGAMGIPTWVIVPIMPYYIWALPGDTSPWYDSVKLFRQTEYGSWDEPFERIATKLNEVL